ncbi:hypothetical protein [uncultured Subdoligranulum sp.]|uniref:hypothetical protein n=1 Tax=uncultured Subdoligranulum sp. TaxID=512298 RepID=UPI002631CCD2|nr:hypothetical protein [uncultured Subdoligranulum sp.]
MSERKQFTDKQLDDIWKEMLKPDAAEPPLLDRSAWEPCEYCEDYSGKCCANCWNGGNQAHQEPCKSCYCASKWKPKENFCPYCGRPMHDAAWEMLERRLAGRENQ